jgi:hypothetical protein
MEAVRQEPEVQLAIPDSYEMQVSRFPLSSWAIALICDVKRVDLGGFGSDEALIHVVDLRILPS